MTSVRPERSEAAEYYFRYIDLVPDGDIVRMLASQRDETVAYLERIPEDHAGYRYAAEKWTLRDVVGHLNDTERLFAARAFWFARGFDTPLPSFDQNVAISTGGFNARTWRSLIDEFAAVRDASVTFFASLPEPAWDHRGIASENPFTVRALAYVIAGHVTHHVRIVGERYLPAPA
jgi:DinB superfamily